MTDALVLIMTALAAWRVWRFVALDTFPPMLRFRRWFDGKLGHTHWAVEMLDCPYCGGAYIAFAAVALVWHYRPLPLPGLWFAAASALVGLVAKWEQAP